MDSVATISFGAKELGDVHIGEMVFFFKPTDPTTQVQKIDQQGLQVAPIPTKSVQSEGTAIQKAVGIVFNISETEVTAIIVDDPSGIVTQGTYVALGNELPSIPVGFDVLGRVTDSTGTNAYLEYLPKRKKSTLSNRYQNYFAKLQKNALIPMITTQLQSTKKEMKQKEQKV